MPLKKTLTRLIVIALALPAAICVFLLITKLLGTMGDDGAAHFMGRVTLFLGCAWAVDLVALIVVTPLSILFPPKSYSADLASLMNPSYGLEEEEVEEEPQE